MPVSDSGNRLLVAAITSALPEPPAWGFEAGRVVAGLRTQLAGALEGAGKEELMLIRPPAGTAVIIGLLSCVAQSCRPASGPPEAPTRAAINPQTPDRPYSQAVRVGRTYYFAGKVGVTEETRQMTEGRIEAETRNVMESFAELFSQLGLEFGDVVQSTVYLAEIGDYDAMNRVYGEYFHSDPPARETVAVASLVGGARVEISFIAVEPH